MLAKQNYKKGLVLLVFVVSLFCVTNKALCDEIASNCLSYPVIYSNAAMMPRGDFMSEPVLAGDCFFYDNDWWYYQQDPLNVWQAESMHSGGFDVYVDWIDWGDNLESRPWTTNSIVRIETVLYKTIDIPMVGYEMAYDSSSGIGIDEMWGTNGIKYYEYFPTVYASDALITIQYIPLNTQNLEWDRFTRTWIDPEYFPVVMDAPFTAEINVKGKVIHGCNWNVRKTARDIGEGLYRITMSFETNKTKFDDMTQIMSSAEASAESGEPQGGIAYVDSENNLTYIDVPIIQSNGNGGGGGNGGNGSGNSSSSGKGRAK